MYTFGDRRSQIVVEDDDIVAIEWKDGVGVVFVNGHVEELSNDSPWKTKESEPGVFGWGFTRMENIPAEPES